MRQQPSPRQRPGFATAGWPSPNRPRHRLLRVCRYSCRALSGLGHPFDQYPGRCDRCPGFAERFLGIPSINTQGVAPRPFILPRIRFCDSADRNFSQNLMRGSIIKRRYPMEEANDVRSANGAAVDSPGRSPGIADENGSSPNGAAPPANGFRAFSALPVATHPQGDRLAQAPTPTIPFRRLGPGPSTFAPSVLWRGTRGLSLTKRTWGNALGSHTTRVPSPVGGETKRHPQSRRPVRVSSITPSNPERCPRLACFGAFVP